MKKILLGLGLVVTIMSCSDARDKSIFEPLEPREISQLIDDYGDASYTLPYSLSKDNPATLKIIDILLPVFEIIQDNATSYQKERYRSITYSQVLEGAIDLVGQETQKRVYNDSINEIIDNKFAIIKARQNNIVDSIIQASPPQNKYNNRRGSYGKNVRGYLFYSERDLKVYRKAELKVKNYYAELILKEKMPQIEYCTDRSDIPNYEGYELKEMVDHKEVMNTYNPQIMDFFEVIYVPLSPTSMYIEALLDNYIK